MKTKEFNQLVKSANVELNSTFKSPFVICNLLNKAVKGDFSKVANCEGLTKENLAKVAKVVKGMHANRYAFDTCILPKCNGKLGTFIIVPEKQNEKASILCGEVVTFKGKELSINESGFVGIFRPIPLTISGVFNAFAKVAKVEIAATEKAAKESEKAAKKAAKEYENAKKCIIKDYNNGLYGEDVLAEKLANLRTKFGK
jgi:hypothetical protein